MASPLVLPKRSNPPTSLNDLQKKTPEPALRRRQGVFPEVELPLLLALLKHTHALGSVMLAAVQLGSDPVSLWDEWGQNL